MDAQWKKDILRRRIERLERQKYLSSPQWKETRLKCITYHSKNGTIKCFTCGKPINVNFQVVTVQEWERELGKVTVHHLRYPCKEKTFVIARDTMPICGKCHHIIGQHEEMRDTDISKRELRRRMREFFNERKKREREERESRLRREAYHPHLDGVD